MGIRHTDSEHTLQLWTWNEMNTILDDNGVNLEPVAERPDVFVYHRYTGRVVRASVASDGTESDGSGGGSISAHGRWIAFASEAKRLAPDQRDWHVDVFLRDLRAGRTERIAVTGQGTQRAWYPRSRPLQEEPAHRWRAELFL